MKKQSVKRDYTTEQIISLLLALGSEGYKTGNGSEYIFQTVCHPDTSKGSYKLYYYPETSLFHCYTDCGDSFNIYELVKRNRKCNFREALNYIYKTLNIADASRIGFAHSSERTDDWSTIHKYTSKREKQKEYQYTVLPSTLIGYYSKHYPVEWLQEGITTETMDRHDIRYDLTGNKIVIPHFDRDGSLIGLRGRSLEKIDIDQKRKYMPMFLEEKVFNHPLGYNLYGLDKNASAIVRTKKAMIFEAEKSVLLCDGFYGENNFTLACCGSNITNYQRNMIVGLGIKEVFIAFDKEYTKAFSPESDEYSEKILALAHKFTPYVTTYVLWDIEGLLDYQDSPCDKGQDVFETLMKTKYEVITKEE